MDVQVLFENNDVIVVNKPPGVAVHPDGKSEKVTITDWIMEHYPAIKGVGEPATYDGKEIDRPGIVHRLDEETSGALVVAKTPEAFAHFKKQFMDRTIEKEYHAFVWGHFKENEGTVDQPIGRSGSDFRRRLAGRGTRGEVREAVTNWHVVNGFEDEKGKKFSFMHLSPKTGRTHQLRVHMQCLQRPIVADHLYAPSKPEALGFSRLALHARSIQFHGLDGASIRIEAPYPADFEAAIAQYCKS